MGDKAKQTAQNVTGKAKETTGNVTDDESPEQENRDRLGG